MVWLSEDVTKVLQRFHMQDVKPIDSTLLTNSKLNVNQCLKTKREKVEVRKIPYALVVESMMFAMVYTRTDIA